MADDLSPLAAAPRDADRAHASFYMGPAYWEGLATACVMWWSREPVPPRVAKPAAPTERPTCATCPYWQILRPKQQAWEADLGQCRHRSGAVIEKQGNEWCGEHDKFPAWIAARAEGGR